MTAEIGYSYFGLSKKFATILNEALAKAVRVKAEVAKKIKNAYTKFLNTLTETKEVVVNNLERLIDLSKERLAFLAEKIKTLSKPKMTTNKAVLFTGGLVTKIKNVTSNWFGSVEIEETSVPAVEEDTIIPSTWDEYVPTAETVAEVELPVEKNASIETPEEQTKEVEMPELNTNFVPEVEEPANISDIEKDEGPISIQNNMTFELPNLFGNTEKTEYVAEPKLVAEEEKPLEKESMSIEDRIAELLRRTESTKEEVEEKKEETPVLSQSAIMARVQRVNNSMKDKDAKISALESKLNAANRELATQRTKITGYEAVVKDLTVKNNILTSTNDSLTAKLAETETGYESKIVGLEEQVETLSKSKQEETNALNARINDMEINHSEEVRVLKERHAREIEELKESNEKKIEAVYRTISEALGDSYQTEDYSKAA